MQHMGRLVLTLAAVAVISALVLTGVNVWTAPIVADNVAQMHQEVLEEFFPQMDHYREKTVDEVNYDFVYDSQEEFLGVLAEATTSGYAGEIEYYLAVDKQGSIKGLSIINHEETPGIGDIIEESDFQDRFMGKDYADNLEPGKDIDIVSGATASTEAMIDSVAGYMEGIADEVLEKGKEME